MVNHVETFWAVVPKAQAKHVEALGAHGKVQFFSPQDISIGVVTKGTNEGVQVGRFPRKLKQGEIDVLIVRDDRPFLKEVARWHYLIGGAKKVVPNLTSEIWPEDNRGAGWGNCLQRLCKSQVISLVALDALPHKSKAEATDGNHDQYQPNYRLTPREQHA